MPKRRTITSDEQRVRAICDELTHCHHRYPDLRVEGFASLRPLPNAEMSKVWTIIYRNHGNLDEDVVVIPERWRHTENDQYAYRFFGDTTGCDVFMESEKEVQRILDIPNADSRGGSGVFLAGAIGLRCRLPLLGVSLRDGLPDQSERCEGIIEGFDPPPRPPEEPGYFCVALASDPFLSLKIALEWTLNPIQRESVPDGWKSLVGRLPYSAFLERLIASPKPSGRNGNERSWTRRELENAIPEFKAKRASSYWELLLAVNEGRKGARQQARKMFGRNAIARALGVKSPSMVGDCPEYIKIAEALDIKRKPNGQPKTPRRRKAIDEALEDASQAMDCSPITMLAHRDMVSEIRRTFRSFEDRPLAEALVAVYEAGKLSDESVEQMLEDFRAHRDDAEFREKVLHALSDFSRARET